MKLTRGMVVSCPNDHECGRAVHEIASDAPILRDHIAVDLVEAPANKDTLICPRCREIVARSIGGCYTIHIKGRGWVS